MSRTIDIPKALRSFKYAAMGIVSLFANENNAKIHLFAAAVVVTLGFYTHISSQEWIMIILVIGLVWMAEAFNTSLEKLADVVSPQYHPAIKQVKDLAAAGVLIMAAAAVITGLIIFVPKFMELFP
ncbi:diacylglycerol kinase family protein [Dyadobacter tibetensis]|uniref:diacylglycerol kinase family protein n=1 Tax=Dyadobacter tibetensis TaxID=1211851 RepID=UPI0004B08DF6|nr:diacylglycerol kinase family protein [Dyadobacter tibetensis]